MAVHGDAVGRGEDPRAPLLGLELIGARAGFGVRAEPADDLPALSSTLTWPLSSPTIA